MKYISIKKLIDDIFLLVRNNNISESEDLSRYQILQWIKAYKNAIIKERHDKKVNEALNVDNYEDIVDEDILSVREKGPLKLVDIESLNNKPVFTKRTEDKLENIFLDSENSILSVHDQEGCVIQYMNHVRRHYQYFRKYTFGELTAYYDEGYIYVQGTQDMNRLRNIWVEAIYENDQDGNEDDEDIDEAEIPIPAWMVPPIKERILKNELPFMLQRPSDDSNNSTVSSVKPHGPQDDEK